MQVTRGLIAAILVGACCAGLPLAVSSGVLTSGLGVLTENWLLAALGAGVLGLGGYGLYRRYKGRGTRDRSSEERTGGTER